MAYTEDDPYGLGQADPDVDPTTGLPWGQKRITDPTTKAADPSTDTGATSTAATATLPVPAIPTNPDGSQVGSGIPWTPGSSAPSSAPAGYSWNDDLAMYGLNGSVSNTAPAGQYGDADILSQINKWSLMPGADPSLANDPQYWLRRIKETGGLSAANLDFWQKASVGDNAFFRNPNRESGGSSTGGSLMDKLNALFSRYSNPVTADDPIIAARTQAYTGRVGRGLDAFKSQAAERAYAEGVPTGAFDSQIGNATLATGRSVGDYEADLMGSEENARRSALGQLLGINSSYELGSTGLSNQNNQYYDKLGIDAAHEDALLKYLYDQLKLS